MEFTGRQIQHGVRLIPEPNDPQEATEMATSGFAPPSLSWSSTNLPEAYRSFRQYTTLIFDGPFANKTEKEKVTYLLIWIGSHGRDIYEGWTWNSPDDKFKLKLVLDKFQQHIEPQVNSYLARYNFHKSRQTADESVDEFVARLRVLAAKCKFADVGETHVRLIEQIIVGTKHVAVQEKLLEKGDSLSSLDAALDIARTYEATKSHVAQLQSTSSSTVHGVQKQQSSASASTNCTRCGLDHSTTATCPAKGATCLNRPLYLLLSGFARGQALGCHAVARADRMQKSMQKHCRDHGKRPVCRSESSASSISTFSPNQWS